MGGILSRVLICLVIFVSLMATVNASASDLRSSLNLRASFQARLASVERMLAVKVPRAALEELKNIENEFQLNDDEKFVVETVLVKIFQEIGDQDGAVKGFERVLEFEKLTDAKSAEISRDVGILYAASSNYPAAACWLEYYRDKGGDDQAVIDVLTEVYRYASKGLLGADGKFGRSAEECRMIAS